MKNLFPALALLLLAQATIAFEIDFTFAGTDQETNFTAVVASGEDFTYKGTLTKGKDLTKMTVSRQPDQTARNCYALIVDLEDSQLDVPLQELFTDDAWVMDDYIAHDLFQNRERKDTVYATKADVRQCIQTKAAEMEKDDVFFLYYSGYCSDEANIALYDDYYTSGEFAEDLSNFKDGVIIIIMLDADNSHLIANKGIQKDNKNFLIITASKDLPKKIKKWQKIVGKYADPASPFTFALWKSQSIITDLDDNGLISFDEYFLRAKAWLDSKKLTNELSMNNQELASKLYLSPVPGVSNNGRVSLNEDGSFEFTLPNIQSDAVVFLEEGTVNPDFVLSPAKGKISANLKEAGPNHPTKLNITFTVDDIPEFDFFSLSFGNYFMPFDTLLKETERSLLIGMVDYNFNVAAKFKYNLKKGYSQCNISLKGTSKIANELKFEDGEELVPLQVNSRGALSSVRLPFTKTYKPEKTFSAKMLPVK